jgi:hypothetical protein
MRSWNRAEDASGYFELVKGPSTSWDKNVSPTTSSTTNGATLTGYTKDGLFFTTRSSGAPFTGRAVTTSNQAINIESQVAEVAWFLQPTSLTPPSTGFTPTVPPTYTLYRRQLLVLPGIGTTVATGSPAVITAGNYYDTNVAPSAWVPLSDISAHPDGTTVGAGWQSMNMVLNSLADLSYRENRFAHFYPPSCSNSNLWGNSSFGSGSSPFPVVISQVQPFPSTPATDPNLRYGEDVVLTNVLSFDVKVWDPWAQVLQDANGNPLVPSDPGYGSGTKIGNGVYGAYVDLNWGAGLPTTAYTNPSGVSAPYFALGYYGAGQKSYLAPSGTPVQMNSQTQFPMQGSATYDTWPAGYEAWLYNAANSGTPISSNQAFDGMDSIGSGASGGVDSPNERLTSPPYPVPIRGVQIKIRTYEFSTKQVREATIEESFVPD